MRLRLRSVTVAFGHLGSFRVRGLACEGTIWTRVASSSRLLMAVRLLPRVSRCWHDAVVALRHTTKQPTIVHVIAQGAYYTLVAIL